MTTYSMKDIPEDLWEKFKNTIPRKQTIDEAFIEMMEKRVEEHEN